MVLQFVTHVFVGIEKIRDAPLDFQGRGRKFGYGWIFFFSPLNGADFFSSPSQGRIFFLKISKIVCSKHKDEFFSPPNGSDFFSPSWQGGLFFFSENFLPPPGNLMVRP